MIRDGMVTVAGVSVLDPSELFSIEEALGTIKVGGQYMNEVETCDIAGYTMPELPPSNPANDYGHYKGSAANHGYIFDNIHAALSGAGEITTNALEGLKVVDIIERMYAAGKRPLKQD